MPGLANTGSPPEIRWFRSVFIGFATVRRSASAMPPHTLYVPAKSRRHIRGNTRRRPVPSEPCDLPDTSEKECVSFQTEHQYDEDGRGEDRKEGLDQLKGTFSEACRFWYGTEHRRGTETHAPPVSSRKRTWK